MRRPRKKGSTGSTSEPATESQVATRAPEEAGSAGAENERAEKAHEAAPQSVGDTSVAAPDRDRIAMRAYELYLERGGSGGRELEDWLTAERELTLTRGRGSE